MNLRAYGQRDPLIEYKKEAFEMFEQLMMSIKTKVVSAQFRSATAGNVRRMMAMMQAAQQRAAKTNEEEIAVDGDQRQAPAPAPVKPAPAPAPAAPAEPLKPEDNKRAVADVFASMMSRPVRVVPRPSPAAVPKGAQEPRHDVVGRNDPCPCGSGKKFKKCCGRNLV